MELQMPHGENPVDNGHIITWFGIAWVDVQGQLYPFPCFNITAHARDPSPLFIEHAADKLHEALLRSARLLLPLFMSWILIDSHLSLISSFTVQPISFRY
ncbi:hypothetical protein L6164_024363 [Bauhinia variegata]|uniref:Uncharacterized protein n=1 Tax=Bauhinia variegata TaxID=167791 RepID=A0ACB9LX90_BAUVA|nr:hypothetical protein L6164_024363 [Bauhinia variegata]